MKQLTTEFEIAIPVSELGGFNKLGPITSLITKEAKSELKDMGIKQSQLKDCEMGIEFIETDSGNIHHAAAYYRVSISGPKEKIKKIEIKINQENQ